MKKPLLVLWDWNGTLLDDIDFSVDCLNVLLKEHGYPQQYTLAEYRKIFGFPIESYYQRAGFDFLEHSFAELAKRYIEIFTTGSKTCDVIPGARQALELIQNAGIPQVILSASPTDILTQQVAERGLSPFFKELLGLDDIYAKSKTARGTDWIANCGICPSDVVMIGDTDHDAQVAKAMGVRCILSAAGHQTHKTLALTGASVIDDFTQLPALLNL